MKKISIFFIFFVLNLFFSPIIIAITENSGIIKEKQSIRKDTMELILVCHEKIQFDLQEKIINFENIDLSSSEIEKVKQLGEKMRKGGYSFDIAYTSHLKIANKTLNCILEEMTELQIPINKSQALSTVTYKDLEEKNVFENLKSYWISDISKSLKEGKNVLIVTDEGTIRNFIKYLLDMPDEDILEVYIPIDNSFYFEMDKNLDVIRAGFPIQEIPERIDEF